MAGAEQWRPAGIARAGRSPLLPAALATGVGTDTQRPFAIVIVGGLIACLAIIVFLMPALYAFVAREGDRLEV